MTRVATVPALARLKAAFARHDEARAVLHRGSCGDPTALARAADALREAIGDHLVESTCDGACWAAPAATVQRDGHSHRFAHIEADGAREALARCLAGDCDDEYAGRGQFGLLERMGRSDGTIGDAIAHGAYAALAHAARLEPVRVIDAVRLAGTPNARDWRELPGTATRLVVDASDATPGPSRSRHLVEGDPHRLIEGALIACHAIGIPSVRVTLPLAATAARDALAAAAAQAAQQGILDGSALGNSPIEFVVEVTPAALAAAPPGQQRLDVEALSAVTMTFDSPVPPTRLVALTGAIPRPGIYEVPIDGNTTWSGVLATAGARPGLVPGVRVSATAGGGGGARVLRADAFEVPLTSALLGGGDVLVLDRDADLDQP